MLRKMILKEKRVVQLYTLLLFLAMSVVFLAITCYIQSNADTLSRREVEVNEQSLVAMGKSYIISRISGRVSDVLFIADSLLLSMRTYDDNSYVKEEWIAFSNRKALYDQIRYIDQNGNEVIRVNYYTDGAKAVAQAELQNKSGRDYFVSTMKLAKNQVYLSPLDLNIENNAVEQPIKPMLRLSTPLSMGGGEPEGIVILNYYAQDLLEQVMRIAPASAGEVFLLNRDGYWLFDSKPGGREWAFMYEGRQDESFASEYPQEWETIRGGGSGLLQTDRGVFSYTAIDLNTEIAVSGAGEATVSNSGLYYLVSYIDSASDLGALFSGSVLRFAGTVFAKYFSIYLLISGIAFVFAAFIAVNRAQKKEIKYFSEYDVMTGVYNRRSAFQRLNSLRKNDPRNECLATLCFMDINGLKEVNDVLGHDAGDELIISVINVIKANIRSGDYVARLGGDEFLIVFDGLGAADAEKAWERIVQACERINADENKRYLISASHGLSTLSCDSELSVDGAVQQADERMYMEKREIKKNLRVIRSRA